ncbi:MAG: hypothetical protein ACRCUT_07485, partial [Spirochaetota bacterium]
MKKFICAVLFLLAAAPVCYADGFIVLPEPHHSVKNPYPLDVKYHHVDVSIDGLSAETRIE